MRYKLYQLYDLSTLNTAITSYLTSNSGLVMGTTLSTFTSVINFISNTIYGYFYDDVVVYGGEDSTEVKELFINRLGYDIGVKLPYWYRKYNYIKKLLTDDDFSLMQTSDVTSSSSDETKSAGGSLQKGATTPTGVATTTSPDEINITIDGGDTSIETEGFVDKYTNYQQKYANANRVEGSRSGNIHREGSIDELLNILEKLPASFGNEINVLLQKHFIFDYDGLKKGYYENE